MDWGNAIVRSVTKDSSTGIITSINMDLHLEGDFRKTKKKITWLAQPSPPKHPLIPVTLLDHDYLITKKKLEEDDSPVDFLSPKSEFREDALADANVVDLQKGDIMQFERKGYFVFDGEGEGGKKEFVKIPDGRAASIASKATADGEVDPAVKRARDAATAEKGSAPAPAASAVNEESESNMYKVTRLVEDEVGVESTGKMYKVVNIHHSVE